MIHDPLCSVPAARDIGCLGTKTKLSGESMDAYHIFVGGGFGRNQAVGRQIFSGVLASELAPTLERILRAFLRHRQGRETFQQFARLDRIDAANAWGVRVNSYC